MSFDIFYWKFYIWDWIFNFLLKFQDFCKWKFVKTVIMYEFLAFLTQLITFKRWKHVKIAEKIGFPVFGNEFHHLGNEFHHFFGNEFRSNRAKKKPALYWKVFTARCLESINLSASPFAPTVLNSAYFHTSKSLMVYILTQAKPNLKMTSMKQFWGLY